MGRGGDGAMRNFVTSVWQLLGGIALWLISVSGVRRERPSQTLTTFLHWLDAPSGEVAVVSGWIRDPSRQPVVWIVLAAALLLASILLSFAIAETSESALDFRRSRTDDRYEEWRVASNGLLSSSSLLMVLACLLAESGRHWPPFVAVLLSGACAIALSPGNLRDDTLVVAAKAALVQTLLVPFYPILLASGRKTSEITLGPGD